MKLISTRPAADHPPGWIIPPLHLVADDLDAVNRDIVATFCPDIPIMRASAQAILTSSGKRIRPAMVLLAAATTAPVTPRVRRFAAVMEVLHLASLLHDDVVDNTQIRRGQPSVNALFGNKTSVLLADYLLSKSFVAICEMKNTPILKIIAQAAAQMATGQLREVQLQHNPSITVDEYLLLVREKTASLLSASARVGALAAGAAPEVEAGLAAYGLSLGMAFQIVDDCLDFWGNPDALGKPVGTDLAEAHYTLPILHTLSRATLEERTVITEAGGAVNLPIRAQEFQRVLAIMDAYESRTFAEAAARDHLQNALAALEAVPPGPAKTALVELAHFVVSRQI